MAADERVLGIPTEHFHAVGLFQGFRPADDPYAHMLLDSERFEFRPRSECETDPGFQQLIPYAVLRHGEELFHYRRGASGTEARLRALRSIGIGGHISEADAGTGDLYRNGLMRELFEEVTIGGGWTEQLVGFINDDSLPVGRVHLGIVHVFELECAEVRSNEDALAGGGFAPLRELWRERNQFETWSRFVLEWLIATDH